MIKKPYTIKKAKKSQFFEEKHRSIWIVLEAIGLVVSQFFHLSISLQTLCFFFAISLQIRGF